MNGIVGYVKESYNELINKVTWPTWSSLISTTNLVIVATIILTFLIFLMDTFSSQLLDFIYSLGA